MFYPKLRLGKKISPAGGKTAQQAKLEAAQSVLERQAQNMLPARMDKYMVSAETVAESNEISDVQETSEATADASAPQSDPERK